MKHGGKPYYAIFAGLCASGGSFFGKLTSNIDHDQNVWVLRAACLLLMILCNGLVWTFFVKALHDRGGSLIATVVSAATNYFLSAVLGFLVFGEKTSAGWWLGTVLVLCGLVLIVWDNSDTDKTNKTK